MTKVEVPAKVEVAPAPPREEPPPPAAVAKPAAPVAAVSGDEFDVPTVKVYPLRTESSVRIGPHLLSFRERTPVRVPKETVPHLIRCGIIGAPPEE